MRACEGARRAVPLMGHRRNTWVVLIGPVALGWEELASSRLVVVHAICKKWYDNYNCVNRWATGHMANVIQRHCSTCSTLRLTALLTVAKLPSQSYALGLGVLIMPILSHVQLTNSRQNCSSSKWLWQPTPFCSHDHPSDQSEMIEMSTILLARVDAQCLALSQEPNLPVKCASEMLLESHNLWPCKPGLMGCTLRRVWPNNMMDWKGQSGWGGEV